MYPSIYHESSPQGIRQRHGLASTSVTSCVSISLNIQPSTYQCLAIYGHIEAYEIFPASIIFKYAAYQHRFMTQHVNGIHFIYLQEIQQWIYSVPKVILASDHPLNGYGTPIDQSIGYGPSTGLQVLTAPVGLTGLVYTSDTECAPAEGLCVT